MIFKEYVGSTPKYNCTVYDSDGAVINPSTAFTKIIIYIYNNNSKEELIKYSSESPAPSGYYSLTRTSSQIRWAIPHAVSAAAEKGENRVEIWLFYTDSDIPTTNLNRECISGILNEFIDTQFISDTTTAAPTTTEAATTTSSPTTTA